MTVTPLRVARRRPTRDLAAAEGDRDRADECYEEAVGPALPGDAERSEIRARALYRRGLNKASVVQTSSRWPPPGKMTIAAPLA